MLNNGQTRWIVVKNLLNTGQWWLVMVNDGSWWWMMANDDIPSSRNSRPEVCVILGIGIVSDFKPARLLATNAINGGSPKWLVYKGKSSGTRWFRGNPIYGNPHMNSSTNWYGYSKNLLPRRILKTRPPCFGRISSDLGLVLLIPF